MPEMPGRLRRLDAMGGSVKRLPLGLMLVIGSLWAWWAVGGPLPALEKLIGAWGKQQIEGRLREMQMQGEIEEEITREQGRQSMGAIKEQGRQAQELQAQRDAARHSRCMDPNSGWDRVRCWW